MARKGSLPLRFGAGLPSPGRRRGRTHRDQTQEDVEKPAILGKEQTVVKLPVQQGQPQGKEERQGWKIETRGGRKARRMSLASKARTARQ